jgi:hypothetical protein
LSPTKIWHFLASLPRRYDSYGCNDPPNSGDHWQIAGNARTCLGQERWMGHEKGVNLSEITLCLLYDCARTGNRQSLDATRRIVERRKAEKAK